MYTKRKRERKRRAGNETSLPEGSSISILLVGMYSGLHPSAHVGEGESVGSFSQREQNDVDSFLLRDKKGQEK